MSLFDALSGGASQWHPYYLTGGYGRPPWQDQLYGMMASQQAAAIQSPVGCLEWARGEEPHYIKQKEDKLDVKISVRKIDDHYLAEAGCVKFIAHDKKEFKKKAFQLLEKYLDTLMSVQPQDPRELSREPAVPPDEQERG